MPIVIFDGECGFCDWLVRLLIRLDRHGVFRICSGDSEAGRALIARTNLPADITERSIVVVQGSESWTHASAVAFVLARLPFPWNVLSILRWVPRPLADAAYRLIARYRHTLRGTDPACAITPPALREIWLQRMITGADALTSAERNNEHRFDVDVRFRPLLWLWGVDTDAAFVRVDENRLLARFGLFWVDTELANIASAQRTGPYKWYRAIGVRESFADHGLTFGSTTSGGVCIRFHQPVAGIGRKSRHPGLTVTVARPEQLVDQLNKALE